MKEYKHVIFLGDSFTQGEDSGGDKRFNEYCTYPYYFVELLPGSQTYENRGIGGNSNDAMYLELLEFAVENKGRDLSDVLIVVGATLEYRLATSIDASRLEFNKMTIDNIRVQDKEILTDRQIPHFTNIVNEDDRFLRWMNLRTVMSIKQLANAIDVDSFVFNMLMKVDSRDSVLYSIAYDSPVRAVQDDQRRSKSGHLYGPEYKALAERVFQNFTDYTLKKDNMLQQHD